MIPPPTVPPLKILLADDDRDERFFFETALAKIPVSTSLESVSDGERLMEYLNSHLSRLPSVIFLDLNMPRKDGPECLVAIKSDPKLKHIPVVIYSTSYQKEVADILYKNGAHYYLQKCDFAQMEAYIARIFEMLAANPYQPPYNKFVLAEVDELKNTVCP